MTDAGQHAGIYTRMSLAAMNDPTKVEDQARISRELAGRIHWKVVTGAGHPHPDGVYTDNSRSAWQRNRKRPAWDQMLADVEAGRLDSIIVYHGDRLVRQPFDLETLLNLSDGKGVHLASPTGTRDLDNGDDLFILRIEVAAACRESWSTSRRRKAQYERWRREGRVRAGGRGGRAFGFATDGVTHIPGEAAAIRQAAERVLRGETTGAIAQWLNGSGFATPAGGPFTHGTVRKMLARPRYAGLMPDGENSAAWEPVLDRPLWEAVCAVLDAKAAGFGYASNARRWLLSGISYCGACSSPLQIRAEHRRPQQTGYGCVRPGCRKVQRNAALLDEYVITRVLDKLNDRATPPGRLPSASAAVAGEFRALAAERARVEAMLADHTKGRADLLMRRLDSIDGRLAQLRQMTAEDAGAALLARHAGMTRKQWDSELLPTQRALVAACFRVAVDPAGRRGPGFDPGTVRLLPPSVRSHTNLAAPTGRGAESPPPR